MNVLNVGNFKEKTFGVRQMVNYTNDFDSYRQHGNGDYYFGLYAREMFDSADAGLSGKLPRAPQGPEIL